MATATMDVRVLGAGFMAKVMRRGMTTALDEVERRIKRDHDKMNAAYGTDYDAAVEDCLGVVAAVRADAERAPLPPDDAEGTAPSVASALELAAQECEHVASRHEDAATRATASGRDVLRAFAAEMRTLAARVRAVPRLAKGGPL